MKTHTPILSVIAAAVALTFPPSGFADPILYFNDTPTSSIAMASRPSSTGKIEIETADDFLLGAASHITSGTFTGLVTGGSITAVDIEIYRIFPQDSNNPPSGAVPTRANSPSDVELVGRDSGSGSLSFTTTLLSPSFTANNSVLNGINPSPNQTTGGEGSVRGGEVQFDFSLITPIDLAASHYFFVPQVQVTGGEFYWLSASRPISGLGTTPFSPDLQTWIRNENLAPNWLRVGTDIVGGVTPPTFNAAFSLKGTADTASVPDTGTTFLLLGIGLGFVALVQRTRKMPARPPAGGA